jgi:hypothetical protein
MTTTRAQRHGRDDMDATTWTCGWRQRADAAFVHRVAVSVAARVPPELKNSVFRGTSAVRQGLLTPNELRGPAWRRLFKDVYVDSTLPLTHQLRARAAAAYVVPGSVVTGVSAAALWGVDLAGADDAVELTVPPGTHPAASPG